MRETTWWFPLAPTPYTTQQSVCSLPVPVPWTYPDVAAVQYQALKSSSPQVCPDYASYSSDRSKFSISSTSLLIREPVKQVTSAVLLLFAVLQSVLSPQGKQCLWWSFPSLHLLPEPSFYISSGAQQASECFWALPHAQQCQELYEGGTWSILPNACPIRSAWTSHPTATCSPFWQVVCSSVAGPPTCSITTLNSLVVLLYSESKVSTNTNKWERALKNMSVTESTWRRLLLSFPPIILLQAHPYSLLQTMF